MLKSLPFANATAVVFAIFYIVCASLSYLLPDLTVVLVQSWFHNFGLQTISPIQLSINSFILGIVSLTLVTWISAYILAEVYNRLAKTK